MKIKTMLSQHRRDFTAILVCEHCEAEQKLTDGYDDDFFHRNVIPRIKCKQCDKAAPDASEARTPKYSRAAII